MKKNFVTYQATTKKYVLNLILFTITFHQIKKTVFKNGNKNDVSVSYSWRLFPVG